MQYTKSHVLCGYHLVTVCLLYKEIVKLCIVDGRGTIIFGI